MKAEPLFDDILVELTKKEGVEKIGSIIVPVLSQENAPATGRVIATGPGLPREVGEGAYDMPVKIGDLVMLRDSNGFTLTYNEKTCVLLNVREVLMVVIEQ